MAFLLSNVGIAQTTLSAGDIAFIGWNSDGNDDIVFLTFVDISTGTVIYFSDDEYNNGWASSEGVLTWTAPSGGVNAGMLIQIYDCATTSISVSRGSISRTSGSFNISVSEEAVYAYQSDDSWDSGNFSFIAALCNQTDYDSYLNGTTLTDNIDAWSWGDKDNWKYIGPTSSNSISEMKTNLQNSNNWEYTDGSGDQSFTFSYSDFSLPVELQNFNAVPGNSKVTLCWTTESETENLGFILSRKVKGESVKYEEIASYLTDKALGGHGSTSERHEYSYTDYDVINGVTYSYKIEDVDYSGTAKMHDIVVTATPTGEAEQTVCYGFRLQACYPNPFNPETTLRFELGEVADVQVQVYDLLGNLLNTLTNKTYQPGLHSLTWNGRDINNRLLSTGIYFMQVSSSNGFSNTQKVVFLR